MAEGGSPGGVPTGSSGGTPPNSGGAGLSMGNANNDSTRNNSSNINNANNNNSNSNSPNNANNNSPYENDRYKYYNNNAERDNFEENDNEQSNNADYNNQPDYYDRNIARRKGSYIQESEEYEEESEEIEETATTQVTEEVQEEEEPEENGDSSYQKRKELEEGIKLAKNAVSGNYAGAIKNAAELLKKQKFKKILKRKMIKGLLKILTPLIAAILLFGVVSAMKDKMIDLLANAATSITSFLSKVWVWFTDDYWVKLDSGMEYVYDANTGELVGIEGEITDEELAKHEETVKKTFTIIDEYIKELGDNGLSLQALRLLGDGADYSDETKLLDNEENKALVEKYISEFIRADVITQQPHRRRGTELVKEDNQNWVDGGVYIYRTKKEPEIDEDELVSGKYNEENIEVKDKDYKLMEYMKYDEFMEKVQKNDKGLRYYFTINNENGNLVIAEIKEVTTKESEVEVGSWFEGLKTWWQETVISGHPKYTVEAKELDYLQYISKYTLPYEFLINLCQVTQNPEFVYHVALLARNTNIVIAIQDNTTAMREASETIQTYRTYENDSNSSIRGAEVTDERQIKIRKATTTTTQSPVIQTQYADTWSFYEQFKYTKSMESVLEATDPTVTFPTLPDNLTEHVKTKKDKEGNEVVKDRWWEDELLTTEETSTQVASVTTTYNQQIVGSDNDAGSLDFSIEKSKQFLGLLRNNNGKCEVSDCFEKGKNPIKSNPKALKCVQKAEFDKTGKNVEYQIPGMTRKETPLNNLTSGIGMLYAALGDNSSKYESNSNSQGTTVVTQSSNTQNDSKSEYYERMQGLVEHLRYLMTFPENESYTVKDLNLDVDASTNNSSNNDNNNNLDPVQYDNVNDTELEMLYKVCQAEAGGSSEAEIGHVASVVLNRVKCSKWPNTIKEVIFQKSQFSCVASGSYDKQVPTDKTKRAVDNVLQNGDTTGGAVYFRTEASARAAGMPCSSSETHKSYIFLFKDPNTHIFYTDKQSLEELQGSTGNNNSSSETIKPTGKLKDIFPNGVPTTESEIRKYLTTIEVPITTKDGKKTTKKVTVHKAIAEDLKKVLQKAQDEGFKVYDIGGFSWRNIAHSSSISQHALGLAVDINVKENYCVYPSSGKVDAGSYWKPGEDEYSIPKDGVLVKAFNSIGWGWGGTWKSKKDYMHFSYTGG